MIQIKDFQFAAISPQRTVYLRLGDRKSRGCVCTLCFLNGLYLLLLGRNFRGDKT